MGREIGAIQRCRISTVFFFFWVTAVFCLLSHSFRVHVVSVRFARATKTLTMKKQKKTQESTAASWYQFRMQGSPSAMPGKEVPFNHSFKMPFDGITKRQRTSNIPYAVAGWWLWWRWRFPLVYFFGVCRGKININIEIYTILLSTAVCEHHGRNKRVALISWSIREKNVAHKLRRHGYSIVGLIMIIKTPVFIVAFSFCWHRCVLAAAAGETANYNYKHWYPTVSKHFHSNYSVAVALDSGVKWMNERYIEGFKPNSILIWYDRRLRSWNLCIPTKSTRSLINYARFSLKWSDVRSLFSLRTLRISREAISTFPSTSFWNK